MSTRRPVSFLVFSASLRAGSLNTRLAKLAAAAIERHEGKADLAAMSAFDAPSYSQDAQATGGGFPPGATELRNRLEHLGARVYPDMFSLAQAHQAFDAQGNIANPKLADRFDQTIAAFMDLAEAAKHYPCAKTAWVEFLGERPDSPVDRVDTPA